MPPKKKTPQGSRRPLSARPSLHIAVAEADAELSAARAYFYQTIDAGWAAAQTAPGSLEDRRSMRTANVHAVNTAIKVIDQMYRLMGGTSVYETSLFATALSRCPCGSSPHDGWRTRDGTGRACDARSGRASFWLVAKSLTQSTKRITKE